ncbi:serine hydrolase domain-containing protein [Xylanimonas sp. McL0601]|uniref:serine hydrolase domain-containing protein n=1 Tax=Xylanimonas sp. McL0601 TaxID=3414739 RepID=UPI003CFADB19
MHAALSPAVRGSLTSALAAQRHSGRLPAASAAVARAGGVAWAGADGVVGTSGEAVGPEHAFRVGSITKTMVAVAVMRLVEAGAVALEDDVGMHLPDAPAPGATLAHVLSHTAGLPAEPDGPWWERAGGRSWEQVTRHSTLTPPGDRFHYSNIGFAVLGRLLEVVHGQPWDAVLRDGVWLPLGMTSTGRVPTGPDVTGYAVHPHADLVHAEPVPGYAAMGAAGEVWSTPSDLARFGSWLVASGPRGAWSADDDELVLPVAARRRMCTPRVLRDEPDAAWTAAYGLGVMVWDSERGSGDPVGAAREAETEEEAAHRRRRTAGHGGSVPGFQAGLRADTATGDVVAMCVSSTAGAYDPVALLDVLDAAEPWTPPGEDDGVAAETLDLAGTWYWGPAPFTLRVRRDGLLELTARGGRGTVFAPSREPGAWVGVEGGYWLGETLRPVERDGRTVALDVGTFCFTRSPYAPEADLPGGPDPDGWRPLPTR